MNLKELAALVLVRNHIAMLIDTQWRTLKNNADFKSLDGMRLELDKLFVEEAVKLDLDSLKGLPYALKHVEKEVEPKDEPAKAKKASGSKKVSAKQKKAITKVAEQQAALNDPDIASALARAKSDPNFAGAKK